MTDQRPIAVFDSGLGGLTVVRALRRRLPAEAIIYFGDTARVPYGIKSSPTISRFAVEIVKFLSAFDPKAVVVACNTASAVALDELRRRFDLPIWDVIGPGAAAAAELSRRGPIGLIATEATVASEAYPRAIRRLNPSADVVAAPAPLLVPIVEEGRDDRDPIVKLAVEGYLSPLLERIAPAGVLLGCTHYPLLATAIKRFLGGGIALIDSAEASADFVAGELRSVGLARPGGGRGLLTCLVSDNPERFARVGARFLGEPPQTVQYVGPDEFFEHVDGCRLANDA